MQSKRRGVIAASWPGDSPRRQPRALGLIANLFILFLLVAPTAGPTSLLLPLRAEEGSAPPQLEAGSPSDQITSSVERTSELPAELQLRFGALPHAPAVRVAPEWASGHSQPTSRRRTGAHDSVVLRTHLSAGVLFPYRSTAPPQS